MMDLVLCKLEKDNFAVFISFQNKYLKTNSRKSHLLTRSNNILHINVCRINSVVASMKNYQVLIITLISVICSRRTSEPEQYTQNTRLKKNDYEIFNTFLRRRYNLIEKIYYSQQKFLHGCLQYIWYRKKIILHLGLSRSPGNKFLRPFESKYGYCIFLYEFFSFYKFHFTFHQVPFALDHACFFRNILPQHIASNPNDIFY